MAQAARLCIIIYTNYRYIKYTTLGYLHSMLESKVKYKHSIWPLKPNSIHIYNFEFIAGALKQSCNNCINLIMQAAKLYVIIYTNNRYIDYIRLGYLHLLLKSKVNCKHYTWPPKPVSICIYNFEFVTRATKQSCTNYIDLMIASKIKYRYCTWPIELKKSQLHRHNVR